LAAKKYIDWELSKIKRCNIVFYSINSKLSVHLGWINFYIANIVTVFNCRLKDKKGGKQKWRTKS
jgi:hypothetical protein